MNQFVQKTRYCLLILALLLTACSRSPVQKAQPHAETSASPTARPSIQLQPCLLGAAPAQCGTLKVYENRAARSGRMIDLRVAVIKAKSEHPAPDPIFFLAGGPGEAATEIAARNQQFPDSLNQNHDLVFVDQRGTGGSNRVLVPTDQPDFTGLSPEEMDTKAREWVAKFLEEIDMDPRFYTTSVAMDDLDKVREALGYDKINLAGFSYGATAAQYYLRQHEDHVRSVFLYGGSLLDIPVFERWAQNGQRAIDRIFNLCQADPDCHAAFPDLRAQFTAMLARLDGAPVMVSFNDRVNSQAATVTLTKDLLAEVIRNMTKDAKNDSRLPLLIHRANHEGDFGEFAQFFDTNGYEWWGDQVMERVIRCGEKWAAFDPDAVARLSEGSYLKGWDVSLAQAQASSCQYTPRGEMPEGTAPQTGSQVPVLVMNSDLDPIDPPENMAGARDLWPNSLSLVLPYHGHSISDYAAVSCLWSIENEFIQSGSVNGLHTDCLDRIRPIDFVVPVGEISPTPTATSAPEPTAADNPKPVFNTSIGELAIDAVRYVDKVNGIMAGPGEKVLLVFIGKPGLAKLDRNNFSLQAFDTAMRVQSNGEVHIAGNDGSYAVCSMAGWVEPNYESFAMGFRVPATAETFQLFWPGNDPIDLHPEQ